MTGVLLLRTRAAWRRKWPSLLAIALLVAVTLAVTITAVSGARRTRSAPARFFREDLTPDVLVSMQPVNSLRGVDEISKLPQVQRAGVNVAVAAFPYSERGEYLPVFAPIDGTSGSPRGMLLSGRRADPQAADEIMLSEAHARTLGARVGDRVRLLAFDEAQTVRCLYGDEPPPDCDKLFQTPRLSVRVVGITRSGGDVNNRADDITVSTLSGSFFGQHRGDLGWSPIIAIRLHPDASPQSFVAAARRILPAGVEAEFDLQNANASFDAVDVLATGLALFALVAGLAGAFAVGQAVARQVRSDDEERAVLATLGTTRSGLFVDAATPVLIATALGIGAALVATFVASAWMPIGFARRIDPSRGDRAVDWLVAFPAIVACLGLAAGVTLGAVRSSRRRVIVRTPSRMRSVLAGAAATPSALVGLAHACSPGRGRGAVPVRSAFVGVAVATAGIIGVLGFSAGLAHLVDTPALYGWNFDIIGVDPAFSERVVADPAVDAVVLLHTGARVRVNGRPTFGQALAPVTGDAGPAIVAGRAPVAPDEVALGADTLDAAHIRIGGTVGVDGAEGKLTMTVVGQAVFPTGDDAYPLADGAVVAPAALAELGESDSWQTLAVRFRPGADIGVALARLDALDAELDPSASPPLRPVPPGEVEKLRQVESLPRVLAIFLALLGVVALAHALAVSARRRARDFALLRALGFRRRNVRAAVSWEAGALAFAGAAIGIPAGIILARLAWARTADGIGVLVVQRMAFAALLVIVPAAIAIAIAIALVPARRASRMRPAEVLRSE